MPKTVITPRFAGAGEITFVDRVIRDPGPGELRIAVRANAICGTDREQYLRGSEITPGHEAAGIVEAAGADTHVPEGTAGVVYLMDYCGTCRSCLHGFTNQCTAKRGDMGFTDDGGYGPFEIVHESNFFPIEETLSPSEATLLLDVMGTSGHAVRRAELVRPDIESAYIAGAGPIGLGLLAMCRLLYGESFPVTISDLSPWRREFARSLGAQAVDALDPEAMRAIAECDVAFDSTGKQSARQAALKVLGRRGVMVCVGHGETITLDVSPDLIATERAVLGSEYFRYEELPHNADLLARNREYLGRIITHRLEVTEIGEAFEKFFAGDTGKVVVTQGGDWR
jgi:threonine dehydrogenase-like Zn-dependent dehydrogenase